jgi:hypothetical protein
MATDLHVGHDDEGPSSDVHLPGAGPTTVSGAQSPIALSIVSALGEE